MERIHIIGGGAAGLMAAIMAAKLGADVTVLEKMDQPARKLAITGKGRCNLTTSHDVETAVSEFGVNGRFLRSAFSRFYNKELVKFFADLGVPVVIERGKRYFTESGKASDVVNALLQMAEKLGVEIQTSTAVKSVRAEEGRIYAILNGAGAVPAHKVILATGGASYPGTGSSGDGYAMAQALGHEIVKPFPALVPIDLAGTVHKELDALPLKNVRVSLLQDDKIIDEEFGETMFTPFGITGPAVLPMGKTVALSQNGGKLQLSINFKPALTPEQVDLRLQREFKAHGKKDIESILRSVLPRRAAPVIARLAGIDPERKGSEATKTDRENLVRLLTSLRFRVKGVRPMDEAIVTGGGVALDQVNPRTMESRLVKGLYFCGEVLDLDAGTGGFNLQAAFSTGYAAGTAAASDS